ncbi:regulatory protein RecX [Thalassotalea agariperforans]
MNKDILHQAIGLLSRREHSLKELRQKLSQRGYELAEINEVLTFLVAENYQSEVRAAESIFRNRVSRGYGWLYIKNELKQKGVSSDIRNSIYQEQDVDWYQQVTATYHKKYADTEVIDHKDKAKRMRFLQYRGFSIDEILSVLNAN